MKEMPSGTAAANNSSILVKRCKNGDDKAFHELYRLHVKAMLNVSMRIVNNMDEAEDILQESFLKAFQHIQSFDEKVSFGVWLKRIVINRSIDFVRKQKINFTPLDEAGHIEDEKNEDGIVYDLKTIKECIGELPDGYRIVLTLYLFENYSHKEISTFLKINEGTSKSQYNRAKKKLIELIKQKQTIHE